jgi:hypothetical protein
VKAGLGRVQQMFNRALVGTLAALIKLRGREEAKRLSSNGGHGHPLLAKYTKSSNPNANTPGAPYPGYGHRPGTGATLLPLGYSTTPDSDALRLHRADADVAAIRKFRRQAQEVA